jgi:hemoglobin
MTSQELLRDDATPSHFERVGGAPAIRAAVDRFYELVLADAALAPFFTGVDMPRQKGHMAALLTTVLGGPDNYTGRDLGEAHRGLGITADQYRDVCGYLVQTLTEFDAAPDIIADAGAVLSQVAPLIIEVPDADGHGG